LEEIIKGAKPADAATTAYGATLRHYHNFLVRGIFAVAIRACPSREKFVATLAGSTTAPDAEVVGRIAEFQAGFVPLLDQIDHFYSAKGLDP
jgi:hypothetical protein